MEAKGMGWGGGRGAFEVQTSKRTGPIITSSDEDWMLGKSACGGGGGDNNLEDNNNNNVAQKKKKKEKEDQFKSK